MPKEEWRLFLPSMHHLSALGTSGLSQGTQVGVESPEGRGSLTVS